MVGSKKNVGSRSIVRVMLFVVSCLMFAAVLLIRVHAEDGLIWPANTPECEINTLYYYLNFNNGAAHSSHFSNFNTIDIGANGRSNVEILAAADGDVITATYSTSTGFGNYIVIGHSDGTQTWYCHLASMAVKPGDSVKQGQVIGIMGNTSAKYSIGIHLHFEWSGGNPWELFYKEKYKSKVRISTEVYQANKKHTSVAASQSLVNYVDNNCILKNGSSYYTPGAWIDITSDIPQIGVGEVNGFIWDVGGTIEKQDVKWVSSNPAVLAVDDNGSIRGLSKGTAIITAYAQKDGKRICEASKTVEVKERQIQATLSKTSYTYTGKAIKPTVKVTCDEAILKKDTDYTVSYLNNIKMGKATVNIIGKGNYTGTVKKTYIIKPVFKISPTSETVNIRKTKKLTIKATLKTGTKKPKITWKSSNKKVATVSSKGKVSIKKKGKTTISATIKTSVGTFTAKCKLTVVKKYTLPELKKLANKAVKKKYGKKYIASEFTVYSDYLSFLIRYQGGNTANVLVGAGKIRRETAKVTLQS